MNRRLVAPLHGCLMLFSLPTQPHHESEKERNLYAKFFVGYWFNELVAGFEQRLQIFCDIVRDGSNGMARPVMTPAARVTLDYHSYGVDNGECADVLVADFSTGHLVAVEAKLGTDFSYEKDIKANAERIGNLPRSFAGISNLTQCLLITAAKKAQLESRVHLTRSNLRRLQNHRVDHPAIPLSLVTWEQFASHAEERVQTYLREHIASVATRAQRPRGNG